MTDFHMRRKAKKAVFVLAATGILFVLAWCVRQAERKQHKDEERPRSYSEIVQSGTLNVSMGYNAVCFFVSGDTLAGFDYENLQAFAKDKHLRLKVTPEMSFQKRMEGLAAGRYDLAASEITVNSELKQSFLFTIPILKDKLLLIQRKEEPMAKSLLQLAQCTLWVVKESPATLRIRNIEKEIGDTIYIKELEDYGQEQLISLVAHNDIDYAVCDENIFRSVADSFPKIDASTHVGFTQFYAWAVNKQSQELCDTLNAWLADFLKTRQFDQICKRYIRK